MSTMQKATAVHVTVMYVGTPALLICFVQQLVAGMITVKARDAFVVRQDK